MNEQTVKLTEQLALKLGTTSEYLWGVLIKQAFISAITDLVFFVIAIILGVLLVKIHRYLSDSNNRINYHKTGDSITHPMIIFSSLWIIFFLVMLFSWGNIINGFFNPEYWALQKVLTFVG